MREPSSNAIAQSCMSSPVRTVPLSMTIGEAQKRLLRYGHTALCVVDAEDKLLGMLSRRDVDIAVRHGLSQAPIATCMNVPVKTIEPKTSLAEIHALMVTYDIGRLPVLSENVLVGIVTRSDLLRQLSAIDSHDSQGQLPYETAYARSNIQMIPSADVLYQHLKERIAVVWPALMLIAAAAKEKGWALYMVGGAVRDLLLNMLGQSYPLTDIDLVVDGAQPGAGGILAEIIQARYPQVAVRVYGEFQTATLCWPISEPVNFSVDIATARTEFYAYPAANPEVEASTIHQDLYRRDFTINAMALRLDGISTEGNSYSAKRLLDFFGGWIDLQQGSVRVIHPNSFIEDPTRIFRAVRFAVRLGFELSPHTEQLIRYAVDSSTYAKLQNGTQKVPALQSRLTTELKYLLSLDRWEAALAEVERVGGLSCMHPSMAVSPVLWRQLRRMVRWHQKFALDQSRWLLLLSLLIAQLPSVECDRVTTMLNLDTASQHRLKHLHKWEETLLEQLTHIRQPSRIFNYLQPYAKFELLLMADRHPYTLGPHIWHYIFHLSRMPPLINGGTLKRLGYRPGPQFREILTAVHQRTLDGDLRTAQSAEAYVLKTYPRDDQ